MILPCYTIIDISLLSLRWWDCCQTVPKSKTDLDTALCRKRVTVICLQQWRLKFLCLWIASTSRLVQETSDGYLLTAMASILLSSSISQLTTVHNYKLQAFLSLPVYFSFFNDQLRSYY